VCVYIAEVLYDIKNRLGMILAKDPDDIRLYEYMNDERRTIILQQLEEKAKELAKQAKKNGLKSILKSSDNNPNNQNNLNSTFNPNEIPPLDCEKKLWELSIDNDQIIFFVFRTAGNA
jgi:hypothetical protein